MVEKEGEELGGSSRIMAQACGKLISTDGSRLGPKRTGGPGLAAIVWPIRSQSSKKAPRPR